MLGVKIDYWQGVKLLLIASVVGGLIVGLGGLAWFLSLHDHASTARCGTTEQAAQVRWSWTFMVLGPYVGCVLIPVLMTRRPGPREVKLGAGFLLGIGTAVLTSIALGGASEESLAPLVIPVLVGVVVLLWWRTKPGRFGGYVLGLASSLALVLMLFNWSDTCF